MDNYQPLKLWRVSIVHRNGYEAPAKYVEAKKKEDAIKLAKQCSNLITDYSTKWSFNLTPLYIIKERRVKKEVE